MKRLLPLCLAIVITACNQPYTPTPVLLLDSIYVENGSSRELPPDLHSPDSWKTPSADTISAATKALLNMRSEGNTEHNTWQYDVPMGGETYSYAHSAILKANNKNAYLKLFNDPPDNMVVLQLDGDKFDDAVANKAEMKIQFDTDSAATYTCSIEPVFGYLKLPAELIKKIKSAHTITIAGEMLRADSIQQKYIIGHKRKRSTMSRHGSYGEQNIPIYKKWYEIKTTPVITRWEFYCSGLSWRY
jgi:hypothetical protein